MVNYKLLRTINEYNTLYKECKEHGLVSVDLETTGLDAFECKIIGISFAIKPAEAFYVQITDRVPSIIMSILEDVEIKKIGHNLKFDFIFLKANGIALRNIYFDTYLAARTLCYERGNLEYLGTTLLNMKTTKYKDIVKEGETLLNLNLNVVTKYACEDADIALRLYFYFLKQVGNVFWTIEMPLLEVIAEMEYTGICVDLDKLKKVNDYINAENSRLQKEIYKNVGVFNINSSDQRSSIFFDKLKMQKTKRLKKAGVYSTDDKARKFLKRKHPEHSKFFNAINEYLENNTYATRYLSKIPGKVNKTTGRLHPDIRQLGADTGRFSVSDPPLQQIPGHSEIAYKIRGSFIAKPGHVLVCADYSQVELRVLAHAAQEDKMIMAFKAGRDLHTETAQLVFQKNEVSKEERSICKTMNFSITYGATAAHVADVFDISIDKAESVIRKYKSTYKKITEFENSAIHKATQESKVCTLLGRERPLYNLRHTDFWLKSKDERRVVNTIIQGTSADILKLAMLKLYKNLPQTAKIVLSVHDEIIIECPEDIVADVEKIVVDSMSSAYTLSVPLEVGINHGKSWHEAK